MTPSGGRALRRRRVRVFGSATEGELCGDGGDDGGDSTFFCIGSDEKIDDCGLEGVLGCVTGLKYSEIDLFFGRDGVLGCAPLLEVLSTNLVGCSMRCLLLEGSEGS
jgi:hypothetical protein